MAAVEPRLEAGTSLSWLNSTVAGAGLTSALGDFCYETTTVILPGFLAVLGIPAAALGIIEGVRTRSPRSRRWSPASSPTSWLHRPLAKVPENALKIAVGVLLSAFGCFWVGEGVGIEWPGHDAALPALSVVFLAVALALVPACRRLRLQPGTTRSAPTLQAVGPKGALSVLGDELLGLFVDDQWLALGVLIWIGAAWLAHVRAAPIDGNLLATLFAGGLSVALSGSAIRRARA